MVLMFLGFELVVGSIIYVNVIIMRAYSKPLSIWAIFHSFCPLLWLFVRFSLISYRIQFAYAFQDLYVPIIKSDCYMPGCW